MKILNSHQINKADQFTIVNEPVASIDLMERAGQKIFDKIILNCANVNSFTVFCGPGNNGGDGLVVARLLKIADKEVEVIVFKGNYTQEVNENLIKVKTLQITCVEIENILQISALELKPESCIIDALFGIGISQPLDGLAAELVQKINSFPNRKVAVDLPSGLSPDAIFESTLENTVSADITFTVQLPKFAFMFSENNAFVGQFECVDIGCSDAFISHQDTPYIYIDDSIIRGLIKPRKKFGHKGTYGHALIIAGSDGKIGASILSSKAALRTGCGLLTAFVPECAILPIHCALPEAMVIQRKNDRAKIDYAQFQSIGFGPGAGTSIETSGLLYELLNLYHLPFVIDADALNCLAHNPEWYSLLKSNIVLTPHPGEFDRLTHPHSSGLERLRSQIHFSRKHDVTIVLKGHHTSITTPGGLTFFNSTGNSGMATAGSGDVLTGIISSLCAQGYQPKDAAVLGVYLHGFAGDNAAGIKSHTAMIATDIIEGIGSFFSKFEK